MNEPLKLHPLAAAYWRGEIRRCSIHLERLRQICAERGASYEATIEELKR